MIDFVRMIAVLCEILVPVWVGAKYGIGAGVAAIAMIILCAIDGAAKEISDEKKGRKV